MKQFGLRMAGNELDLENLIIDYLSSVNSKSFKYLEIGAAGCVSLRAFYDIVKENIKHNDWKVTGVDIDGGWSIDWSQIKSKFNIDEEIEIYINRLSGLPLTVKSIPKASLWIDKNPRELINSGFKNIDICFIDACHCSTCPSEDFLCVENNIKNGGIVIFHDTGILEQGTDWQPHGNTFIDVRNSLSNIGLFDNKFKNWKFIKETIGSRYHGGDGNSCSIFRKNA